MPRQFATLSEFNYLEQRVKKIEDTLGLKTPLKEHIPTDDDFESPDEEERKIISIFMEQDLFPNNVDSFDKSSLPKYTNLNYAGSNKTIIFIRILFGKRSGDLRTLATSLKNEFGETVLIFEHIQPLFTIFVYVLGRRHFKMEVEKGGDKSLIYNPDDKSESLYFEYKNEMEKLTECKGSLTFIINNKKISEYDKTNFINLINIAEGNIGIYAKKGYKDFRLELTPSKKLPLLKLNNAEYKPKLNILLEDKIAKSSDPFPKDIEKQIKDDNTMFIRFYEKDAKDMKYPKGIKILLFNKDIYQIIILAKVNLNYANIEDIGYCLSRDVPYKDKETHLYFVNENTKKDLFNTKYSVETFIFFCKLQAIRDTMKTTFKSTYEQILKTNFDVYVMKEASKHITFNFIN